MYIPSLPEALLSKEPLIVLGEPYFEIRLAKRLLICAAAALNVLTIAAAILIFPIVRQQRGRSLLRSKEALLHQRLFVMREAIDQFTMDMNAAPQNLADLQKANYLQAIPEDPFTHSADWAAEKCDSLTSSNQIVTGICDVHSTAPGTSSFEGTPYRAW